MDNKFFMHRIKCTNGVYDKGIEVKDDFDSAKQSYHAYFGAYAYGHDANTTFVSCMITDKGGNILFPYNETWNAPEVEAQAE